MSADLALAHLRGAVVARLAIDAATVEVVRALRLQNVRAILIKGAAIAERLYDDTEQRFYGDMDLLVEQRALDRAQRVLRDLGFRPILGNPRVSELGPHANAWTRARPRAVVDLHTGVHFCTRDPDALWAEFTRHTRQLELADTAVEVLGDAAQAFVIVTHALADCRQPKPLEDLGRALMRIDRAAWREAAEMAGRLGAGPAFATGLRRTAAGARLVEALGLHYESTAEARLYLAGLPPVADGFRRFAQAGSVRARIRLIADELAPSPDFMRLGDVSPFARRSRAGLVLAYLHRPLWLLFRAPRGLRIWRAASVAQPPPAARSSGTLHRLRLLTAGQSARRGMDLADGDARPSTALSTSR